MNRRTISIPKSKPRAPLAPPVRVHAARRRPERVGEPPPDGVVEFVRPEYRFCPRCGSALEERADHEEMRPTCPNCGFVAYYNPAPAVGAVILDEDRNLLLVRRKYDPKKGLWSLPAGFMDYGERQIDALAREVREETGVEVIAATQLSVEDASDDPRTHALLISFVVDEWTGEPRPGDDASECRWWPIVSPPPDMAWRNHGRVIEKAREALEL